MVTQSIALSSRLLDYVWALARIGIGSLLLWVYVDRGFGMGLGTPADQVWIYGGSPTGAFLENGDLALQSGQPWVDGLFMLALLGFGLGLVLGVATRAAAVGAWITLALVCAAKLPQVGHPLVVGCLAGAIALLVLALAHAGDTLGLGKLVRSPYLK
ncbi:hypothetical protein ACFXJ8_22280 [Nonomuraea sp. NPDC059194]|uniref:hypothetical protein n=1 Tax=Nonomuraea sp. NPDC059194 TaxID=3346764 RepID=UPI00369C19C4